MYVQFIYFNHKLDFNELFECERSWLAADPCLLSQVYQALDTEISLPLISRLKTAVFWIVLGSIDISIQYLNNNLLFTISKSMQQ